jgi:hypothetical protein
MFKKKLFRPIRKTALEIKCSNFTLVNNLLDIFQQDSFKKILFISQELNDLLFDV